MPSLATYKLQPPIDPKEYEKIVCDYCSNTFGGHTYLFGRNGQCQNGVDVISTRLTRIIGVQCKDYDKTVIKEKDIDAMIELAEKFQPPLGLFVIAIAQENDANIQSYVLKKKNEGKIG